jgi:hypothetical protein
MCTEITAGRWYIVQCHRFFSLPSNCRQVALFGLVASASIPHIVLHYGIRTTRGRRVHPLSSVGSTFRFGMKKTFTTSYTR